MDLHLIILFLVEDQSYPREQNSDQQRWYRDDSVRPVRRIPWRIFILDWSNGKSRLLSRPCWRVDLSLSYLNHSHLIESVVCFRRFDNHVHLLDGKISVEMSYFDVIFRRLILTQSFTRGWGNPSHLELLSASRRRVKKREECLKLVPPETVKDNTVQIVKQETRGDRHYIHGKFVSPMATHFPNMVSRGTMEGNHALSISGWLDPTRSSYSAFSIGSSTRSSIRCRFHTHWNLLCRNRWSRFHTSTNANGCPITSRLSDWNDHYRESLLRIEKTKTSEWIVSLLCHWFVCHGGCSNVWNDGPPLLVRKDEIRSSDPPWILSRWSYGFIVFHHVRIALSLLNDQKQRNFRFVFDA